MFGKWVKQVLIAALPALSLFAVLVVGCSQQTTIIEVTATPSPTSALGPMVIIETPTPTPIFTPTPPPSPTPTPTTVTFDNLCQSGGPVTVYGRLSAGWIVKNDYEAGRYSLSLREPNKRLGPYVIVWVEYNRSGTPAGPNQMEQLTSAEFTEDDVRIHTVDGYVIGDGDRVWLTGHVTPKDYGDIPCELIVYEIRYEK